MSHPSLQKVVIVGPESSGKTTLAQQLAVHYQTNWVPEYARSYLTSLDRPYESMDLYHIAKGQLEHEALLATSAQQLLICDTNLLVLQIWSEVAYGKVIPELQPLIDLTAYDLYLLCKPDLPWEPDPLREHPDLTDRLNLFRKYKQTLEESGLPFEIISRQGRGRFQQARQIVSHFMTLM